MSKNVQIPMSLLKSVYVLIYRLEDYDMDSDTKKLCKDIERQIDTKIADMDKRRTFTEYKTTPPGEEREQKRKEYIEKVGIHKDWTTEKEIQL